MGANKFCAKRRFGRKFWAKRFGRKYWAVLFWNYILNLGLGAGLAGLDLGAAGLGWGSPETEIGLCENNGQQQQAISIYFFLEGLGFRV